MAALLRLWRVSITQFLTVRRCHKNETKVHPQISAFYLLFIRSWLLLKKLQLAVQIERIKHM